ncbi:HNH endonuclease [Mycobacterium colombiense]|nr:HNH endonuclease [Mycobacterium colombiense]
MRKGYPVTNCETCGIKIISGSSQPIRFCDAHRPPDSAYSQRRRDLIKGGERIDPVEVFESDDWTCGVCAGPVDPELKFPDPMAASLDHIIPLSRGGEHVRSNVQCAHWICNCRKSAKVAA